MTVRATVYFLLLDSPFFMPKITSYFLLPTSYFSKFDPATSMYNALLRDYK